MALIVEALRASRECRHFGSRESDSPDRAVRLCDIKICAIAPDPTGLAKAGLSSDAVEHLRLAVDTGNRLRLSGRFVDAANSCAVRYIEICGITPDEEGIGESRCQCGCLTGRQCH